MNRRIPLLVAVVGALLVGGATTGTTRASWVDQANVQAAAVSSGAMSLATSASPSTVTVQRGSSSSVRVTVNDTSSSNAKNLRQRVTPALSGSLPSGVTATLTQTNGSGCGSAAQGAVDLNPGGSFTTCVNVTASSSSSATSATVNLAVSGAQVRGGAVAGWRTPTQTVSVPVTISSAAPVLSCSPGNQGNATYAFSWTAYPNAMGYAIITSATGADGSYRITGGTGANQRQAAAQLDPNETMYIRVAAVFDDWSTSEWSNTIRLRRSGSSNNLSCQDLG